MSLFGSFPCMNTDYRIEPAGDHFIVIDPEGEQGHSRGSVIVNDICARPQLRGREEAVGNLLGGLSTSPRLASPFRQ